MLKHLILQNFKAFAARAVFDFAPITLIYGRNSSGKSSILQSLLLLRQSTGGSLNFEGPLTDLGSATHAYTRRASPPETLEPMEVTAIFHDPTRKRRQTVPGGHGDRHPQGVGWNLQHTGSAMATSGRPVYLDDPHTRSFLLPPIDLSASKDDWGGSGVSFLNTAKQLDDGLLLSSGYIPILHKKYKNILSNMFVDNIQQWLVVFKNPESDPAFGKALSVFSGRKFSRDDLDIRIRSWRWAPPLPPTDDDLSRLSGGPPISPYYGELFEYDRIAKARITEAQHGTGVYSTIPFDGRLVKGLRQADVDEGGDSEWFAFEEPVDGVPGAWQPGPKSATGEVVTSDDLLPFLVQIAEAMLDFYRDRELTVNQIYQELTNGSATTWGHKQAYWEEEKHGVSDFIEVLKSVASKLKVALVSDGHPPDVSSDEFSGWDGQWREQIADALEVTAMGTGLITHIGPHRSQVPRFRVSAASTGPVDQRGRTTDERLHASEVLQLSTNGWLKKFGLPYELKLGSTGSIHGRTLTTMELFHRRNGAALASSDVGYGVSQILPLIVQASTLSEGILLVEQPELHLHPAMQANIGSLFAETTKENPQAQIVAETHSEHLIRRIQRLVGLGRSKGGLDPADVSIICVEQDRNGVSFHTQIPLNRQGNFMVRWPGGFFDFEDGDEPDSDGSDDSDDDALAEES